MAILNVHWTIRAIYAIVKPFIHPTTRQKIIFESNNTCDALTEKIDPCQLEEKYGGEAENLTVFWPPHADSNEYGIDPSKLKKKAKKSSKGKKADTAADDGVKTDNIQIMIQAEVEEPNPDEEMNKQAPPKKTHKVEAKKGCGCG